MPPQSREIIPSQLFCGDILRIASVGRVPRGKGPQTKVAQTLEDQKQLEFFKCCHLSSMQCHEHVIRCFTILLRNPIHCNRIYLTLKVLFTNRFLSVFAVANASSR